MLSANTLERVSHSYRRGYHDGYFGREPKNDPVPHTDSGVPLKPFSDFDYSEGFKAGANDAYWNYIHANGLKGSAAGRADWMEARCAEQVSA
jgi:hypothetical protein